jgi:hypothetical protein
LLSRKRNVGNYNTWLIEDEWYYLHTFSTLSYRKLKIEEVFREGFYKHFAEDS